MPHTVCDQQRPLAESHGRINKPGPGDVQRRGSDARSFAEVRSGVLVRCGVTLVPPAALSKAQVRGSRRDTRPAAGKSLWWLLAEGALVEHPGSFTWLPIPHTRIRFDPGSGRGQQPW